jgi:peptide/nickel transport system permease protein
MGRMKLYRQSSRRGYEVGRSALLRAAAPRDLICVGYGLGIALLVVLSYILGALRLLPYNPQEMDLALMMARPGVGGHLLGTDFMGRDILSRLILGTQAYFLPGLLGITIALGAGTIFGVLAGYHGRTADRAITFVVNLIDSFPRLVLILLVIAAFKPGIYYIMVVVGVTNVPTVASLIRGKIQFLRDKSFIILKHILWYNCRSLLIIQATLGMAEAILIETSLSYLGFGVQEPAPSWGNMVLSGANYLLQGKFWLSTTPALAILVTILGFHLLGDGLNNILEAGGKK